MMSGGGSDPMDAIAKMLFVINEKLNIINDKLTIIAEEIVEIPDKTVYKQNFSEMYGVYQQLPRLSENYKNYVDKYGDSVGKEQFLKVTRGTILRWLDDKISIPLATLKRYNDPLTVSFICTMSRVDHELCRLIEMDDIQTNSRARVYYDYLKNAIWYNANCLEKQIQGLKEKRQVIMADTFKSMNVPSLNSTTHSYVHVPVRTNMRPAIDSTDNIEALVSLYGLYTEGYYQMKYEHRKTWFDKKFVKSSYPWLKVNYVYEFPPDILKTQEKNKSRQLDNNYFSILQTAASYLHSLETLKYLNSILPDEKI